MNIKIPSRFLEMLGEYKSECESVYKKYEQYLNSEMRLFKEYTDHSDKHINYVLETAEMLITDECWGVLTSHDIFVLLLSILFHDLGMHLTEEGFKTLIRKGNTIIDCDLKTWEDEWNDYIEEIRKYDQEKQYRIFSKELKKIEEKKDIERLDYERDLNIVGEFIRRNHGRLAHEIARFGFPVKNNEFDDYKEKNFEHLYDLAGYVSRSHNLHLRKTYQYLENKYYEVWKTPYKVHVIYLMILLRISDYLHITNDRINPIKFKLYIFQNEISIQEFKKHESVYDVQQIWNNPETFYVTCQPKELETYLGMNKLINDIQNELDTSWAVLGEVYGKTKLGITLRRISSNIGKKEWLDSFKYIPDSITFKLDPRLINLLIEPLYGDNPSYGIRELIQNAVDACKSKKNEKPEITISLKEKELTIKDNGIGMNLDVIKNYFLSIGSPFLESIHWKETNKDNDIVRNGRFGIGILSSFLLGDIVEVLTYKEGEKYGYEFQIFRNITQIKISRKQIDEIKGRFPDGSGTQIKIQLNDKTLRAIQEQNIIIDKWYKLSDVNLFIDIGDWKTDNNKIIFEDNDKIKDVQKWNIIESTDFNEVKWSYDYKIERINWYDDKQNDYNSTMIPNLICNGLIIPEKYDANINNNFIEKWPTLYIEDKMGKLQLDLSRYKITKPLTFLTTLEEKLLETFFEELENYKVLDKSNRKIKVQSFAVHNFKPQQLVFFKNGYTLKNDYILEQLNPKWIVELWDNSLDLDLLEEGVAYILNGIKYHPSLKNDIYNRAVWNRNIYIPTEPYNVYTNSKASYYKLRDEYIKKIENQVEPYNKDYVKVNNCNNDSTANIDTFMQKEIQLIIEEKFSPRHRYSQYNSNKEIFDKYMKNNYLYPYDNNLQSVEIDIQTKVG